jgi:hypothetical protein
MPGVAESEMADFAGISAVPAAKRDASLARLREYIGFDEPGATAA